MNETIDLSASCDAKPPPESFSEPPVPCDVVRKASPVRVAVIGEFNSGKTTLLNALLGAAVLPASFITHTAYPTVIRFAPRPTLLAVVAGDVDIAVSQPKPALEQTVVIGRGPVHPGPLVAAHRAQSRLGACRQIVRAPLIAREHQALQLDAEQSRRRMGSLEVGSELVGRLSFLETVVMREGMAADLLAGVLGDPADQRPPVVERILLLVRSDAPNVVVGREVLVAVPGHNRW